MINLSRLEEIKDLRTVWPHEALDFTPWLSQDDNISLLADAVGIDITVDETESSVGDFNVDIFASETGTDKKIQKNGKPIAVVFSYERYERLLNLGIDINEY